MKQYSTSNPAGKSFKSYVFWNRIWHGDMLTTYISFHHQTLSKEKLLLHLLLESAFLNYSKISMCRYSSNIYENSWVINKDLKASKLLYTHASFLDYTFDKTLVAESASLFVKCCFFHSRFNRPFSCCYCLYWFSEHAYQLFHSSHSQICHRYQCPCSIFKTRRTTKC